jgi:elongation factor Ts
MTIDSRVIKELREKTGAGILNCKIALQEAEGNVEKASAILRQKGLALVEKKLGRIAKEGIISSYIHTGNKLGVLVELNCETDFVARRIEFTNLARTIAMQIAAGDTIQYVSITDIPEQIVNSENAIEKAREDLNNMPASIREEVIQSRVEKTLKTLTLLDQVYLQDPTITMHDLILNHINLLGENIKINRFVKFVVGD